MQSWYYAAAGGQQHGPLPAAELAALARAGAIGPHTLVWREGLAQWSPLSALAGELGLAATPPPLPGPAAPVLAPAPPPRRSGCLLAGVIVAGVLFLVMVLGVLGAIALPAYQQYTVRAAAAAAIGEARAHQDAVVAFLAEHGRCPGNDEPGFASAASYASARLQSISFGEFEESGLCGLAATISAPGQQALDGEAIWLEYDATAGSWLCSAAVQDRYLPHECRG